MKNTFKLAAFVIASFAVSSASAQALKGNTVPSNANRANDGKKVNTTVNSQTPQTVKANTGTNVTVAQPGKNANSMSQTSNISVDNPNSSQKVGQSKAPKSVNANSTSPTNPNAKPSSRLKGKNPLKPSGTLENKKAGSTNSGQ